MIMILFSGNAIRNYKAFIFIYMFNDTSIQKEKKFDRKDFSRCGLLSVSGGVSFHSQYSIAYNILHRCLQVSNKTSMAVLMRGF